MVKATGNGIRILERCKFRFQFHSFFNDYACNSQNFAFGCEMPSASELLFLWQTWSRYPILEVCEFQFWQFRDSSCHVFIRILAVSNLHLIDPSSIEHNSACFFCTLTQSTHLADHKTNTGNLLLLMVKIVYTLSVHLVHERKDEHSRQCLAVQNKVTCTHNAAYL